MNYDDYEPIPPLPWVDVAERIRKMKRYSASPACFIHAIQAVLEEMGYEIRAVRRKPGERAVKPRRGGK